MKKQLMLILLACMLFVSACTSTATDGQAQESTQDSAQNSPLQSHDLLRVGLQTMPSTLDANASVSNAGIQIYYNIYDTLIMRDPYSESLEFVPGLAESWEKIDDLTWEIKLREGVKFHDGSAMTADDVAYSLNRVIAEEDPSYLTTKSYLLSNFKEFEVIDAHTVHAHTNNPEPLFEHLLSDPNVGISSKAYVESVGIDAAALKPITTAPYKVVEFESGSHITLERFDDYWGEKAPFGRIEFKLMPEIASRETALMNSEVDMITSIPPDQEAVFEGKDNVKLVGDLLPMYHIYRFNMSNPATDDAKLRQAMDYAIDRQALTDSIWEGKAKPATSYQFEKLGEPLYIKDNEGMISYDPEKAKNLVEESDYNGELIEIYNTTDYYTYADLSAQAVLEMWKAVGINAALVQVDDLSSVPYEDKELRTWSNPLYYEDPMGVIERHWAPYGESVKSGDFIPTDDYVKAFEIARYSLDEAERVNALKTMQDIVREETPYIYLYMPYESIAMNPSISYEIPVHLRAHTLALRAGEIEVK